MPVILRSDCCFCCRKICSCCFLHCSNLRCGRSFFWLKYLRRSSLPMGRFRGSSSLVIVAVPALKIHPFCEAFCSLLLSGTAFVSLARRALNHRTRYRPLNCCKRYLVLRFAPFCSAHCPGCRIRPRTPRRSSDSQAPAAVPAASQTVSEAVADAEASMAKSDWKTAEAKLAPWLAAHPADARALFDAGYVADAQSRLDDAVGLYRRAVEANPQSFEAHISVGTGAGAARQIGRCPPGTGCCYHARSGRCRSCHQGARLACPG